MGYIAALDIGTDKTVMAVAGNTANGGFRLSGMKMISSQGMENGMITDRGKVKHYISYLLNELDKQKQVKKIKIAMPAQVLQINEERVKTPLRKRVVKDDDLNRAVALCKERYASLEKELVEIQPVGYFIDGEKYTTRPLGKEGDSLDVLFRIYRMDTELQNTMKSLMEDTGIEEIEFFPPALAFKEALGKTEPDEVYALADMGGAHLGVYLFKNGLILKEAVLPLGTDAIDLDIITGFGLEERQIVKMVKHKYGMAIRTMCKSESIFIPEIKKQLNRKDLAQIIQPRVEELVEGIVYQLQQWNFTDPQGKIYLTGDGSRLTDTNVLMERISGQKVEKAKAANIQTDNPELLEAPACLNVLGLLSCEKKQVQEVKRGLGGWLAGFFR